VAAEPDLDCSPTLDQVLIDHQECHNRRLLQPHLGELFASVELAFPRLMVTALATHFSTFVRVDVISCRRYLLLGSATRLTVEQVGDGIAGRRGGRTGREQSRLWRSSAGFALPILRSSRRSPHRLWSRANDRHPESSHVGRCHM